MNNVAQFSMTQLSSAAFWLSIFYICFVFSLNSSLDPLTYSSLLLGASTVVILSKIGNKPLELFPKEFLFFGVLVLAYAVYSVVRPPLAGFLVDTSYILPQMAGATIFLVTYPAFVNCAQHILHPSPSKLAFAIVAVVALAAQQIFRPADNAILGFQLYGVLSPVTLFQFCYYAIVLSLFRTRLVRVFALVVLLPLMGASSNLFIQFGFITIAIIGANRGLIYVMLAALVAFFLSVAVETSLTNIVTSNDANANVRAGMWSAALSNVANHPLGIGYGTSYADTQAMADSRLMWVYSFNPLRSFEVANHNSFIDLALRLGPIGLLALCAIFYRSWRRIRRVQSILLGSGAIYVVILICSLNPVFESARAVMFASFAAGLLRALALSDEEQVVDPEIAKPATLTPKERRAKLLAQA